LVKYLREFGKHNPRNEELEAILRRCDHEGDQMISYDEFCELVSSNEEGITHEEVDEKIYDSSTKKELSRDISNSPIRKSPSKNDLYEKSIDDTL
jgi:Ca2+-binding EF-hand superfamily protein